MKNFWCQDNITYFIQVKYNNFILFLTYQMTTTTREYISRYNWKKYISFWTSLYDGQCKAMEQIKKEYPRRKIYGNDLWTMLNEKENILSHIQAY